ncbi:hypothetical protein [Nocardia sp. XZ_19_385]|uniref:hypothetical protein n=1 Tax=Nocardia sp. XZ_19_385 TaxID=2769488 RepID=UPI00188ED3C2|nr:hypothetical protein [Nocardia sp. XZ_19_385]
MKRVLGGVMAVAAISVGMIVTAPPQAQAVPGCVISWWDKNALGVECRSNSYKEFRIKALCKNNAWSPWGPWAKQPGQAYAYCNAINQQVANPNFNYQHQTR